MARLTIVREREHKHTTYQMRQFAWRDSPGAGFSFDADAHGNVDVTTLNPAALDNFEKCINGTFDVIDKGAVTFHNRYTVPAAGTCACGRLVELDADYGDGIDCACGRLYNMSGQELAPRSQWDVDPSAEREAEDWQ